MLTRLLTFLRRITHVRGFGIQSPSDFAFVNEVIYERLPYYAYDSLQRKHPDASPLTLKLARILFRVSNYVQPSRYVFAPSTPAIITDHLTAACRHSATGATLYYDTIPNTFTDGDCIVISSPATTGAVHWQRLCELRHNNHLLLFDLHYLGIALVRQQRYGELYQVAVY